jgi:energy-coupling factor transport system permease protein
MKVFEGLRFKRVISPIHNLDPRIKFILSCILFIQAFLFTEFLYLIILFLAQIPLMFIARIQKQWIQTLRGSIILISIIFFSNLIVSYVTNFFVLSSEILTYSTAISLRFVVLLTSFSLFFLTTSPDELGLALEQSHIPYEFCFAFTTAVRFVPVLATEAQTIMDAQKSRGLELEKGGFIRRIRNYIPILVPLIVNAIRRSLELAETMETRAFGAKKQRTNLYDLKIEYNDIIALSISIALLAFTVYLRLYVPIPQFLIPVPTT